MCRRGRRAAKASSSTRWQISRTRSLRAATPRCARARRRSRASMARRSSASSAHHDERGCTGAGGIGRQARRIRQEFPRVRRIGSVGGAEGLSRRRGGRPTVARFPRRAHTGTGGVPAALLDETRSPETRLGKDAGMWPTGSKGAISEARAFLVFPDKQAELGTPSRKRPVTVPGACTHNGYKVYAVARTMLRRTRLREALLLDTALDRRERGHGVTGASADRSSLAREVRMRNLPRSRGHPVPDRSSRQARVRACSSPACRSRGVGSRTSFASLDGWRRKTFRTSCGVIRAHAGRRCAEHHRQGIAHPGGEAASARRTQRRGDFAAQRARRRQLGVVSPVVIAGPGGCHTRYRPFPVPGAIGSPMRLSLRKPSAAMLLPRPRLARNSAMKRHGRGTHRRRRSRNSTTDHAYILITARRRDASRAHRTLGACLPSRVTAPVGADARAEVELDEERAAAAAAREGRAAAKATLEAADTRTAAAPARGTPRSRVRRPRPRARRARPRARPRPRARARGRARGGGAALLARVAALEEKAGGASAGRGRAGRGRAGRARRPSPGRARAARARAGRARAGRAPRRPRPPAPPAQLILHEWMRRPRPPSRPRPRQRRAHAPPAPDYPRRPRPPCRASAPRPRARARRARAAAAPEAKVGGRAGARPTRPRAATARRTARRRRRASARSAAGRRASTAGGAGDKSDGRFFPLLGTSRRNRSSAAGAAASSERAARPWRAIVFVWIAASSATTTRRARHRRGARSSSGERWCRHR